MSLKTQTSRQLIKRSTVTGATPTIPSGSTNHTDGTWTVDNIYPGEFYWNMADRKLFLGSEYSGVTNVEIIYDFSATSSTLTGGTFNSGTGTLTLNNSNSTSVQVTGFTSGGSFTGGSGNCITDLYLTNMYGCSPISIFDTFLMQPNVQIQDSTSGTTLSFDDGGGNPRFRTEVAQNLAPNIFSRLDITENDIQLTVDNSSTNSYIQILNNNIEIQSDGTNFPAGLTLGSGTINLGLTSINPSSQPGIIITDSASSIEFQGSPTAIISIIGAEGIDLYTPLNANTQASSIDIQDIGFIEILSQSGISANLGSVQVSYDYVYSQVTDGLGQTTFLELTKSGATLDSYGNNIEIKFQGLNTPNHMQMQNSGDFQIEVSGNANIYEQLLLDGSTTIGYSQWMKSANTGNSFIRLFDGTSVSPKVQISPSLEVLGTITATTISATTYQNLPSSTTSLYKQITANTTTTNLTYTDVAGLAISASTTGVYEISAVLLTGSDTSLGMRIGMSVPASSTNFYYMVMGTNTAAANQTFVEGAASGSLVTTFACNSFNGQTGITKIDGIVTTTQSGEIKIGFAKITSGTATIRAGSYIRITKIA